MARTPNLPLLPGFTFNPNLGRTNFRIDPKFDFNAGIPCLVEKVRPNLFGPLTDRYPSVYARGEVIEVPAWIAFDKQILAFDAFFKQTLQEVKNAPYIVRKVKIYFFLEDGTIQVMEPQQDNSGITQGCLISRQRIRMPAPMDDNFYDILDFNVGREIELFGKFFKITDCDKFTRNFLNRNGIAVPDPINTPEDPYLKHRSVCAGMMLPKKPNRKVDAFGQFLKNDRKILRFYGYWDDRSTEFGEFHDLEIFYYLADDTIEVKDVVPLNSGRDGGGLLMKRGKLPKVFNGLAGPGLDSPITVLNVLGQGISNIRYITDPLDCGKEKIEYYKDKDLSIGGILNCFGRKIILTDADANTKEYYRDRYGVSSFDPIDKPIKTEREAEKHIRRELPPWNGYGTYEDSAQNCVTVELRPLMKNFKKFLQNDRRGMDSHILRFEARMISKEKNDCERIFIIHYYLSDDTIQVNESARQNEGKSSTVFFSRQEIFMPGQEIFQSEKPRVYEAQHLFVGAEVIINSFQFVLINADEYALRYMERHPEEFPKSNIKVVMEKLREKLRPIYKDFVGEMVPTEHKTITYDQLRSKLCKIMGDSFTEHEMITIARAFSANCREDRLNREAIRAITLTELKRRLWDDLDRLTEYMILRDPGKTGKLSRNDVYTLLRGCRLPVDIIVLEKILDVIQKDETGKICYFDLIAFLDRSKCPLTDIIPINVKSELWWATEIEIIPGLLIDWCEFNKYLNLESIFLEKPPPSSAYVKPMKEIAQ